MSRNTGNNAGARTSRDRQLSNQEEAPASATTNTNGQPLTHAQKEAEGAGWRAEVQEIPKQKSFAAVYAALMLCVFLGALDQTIVAVALPTITRDLGGASAYSWVGSAYLLMAACLAPIWGKLADIVGRKTTLIVAICVFLFGSAMCGAAQNITWLVLCRGVQGIGGGGIIQSVQIVISDITSLSDRGKFTGGIGSIWGIASILGPLIGGAIVDNTTWRWLFFINLPTGGLAGVILIFCLNVPRKKGKTLKQHAREFDYVGVTLIVGGVASVLVGLNNGETNWGSIGTIVPLALGVAAVAGGAVNEIYTKQAPVIPPRLFHTRTTAAIIGLTFFHGIVFFAGSYFLPVYFQVLGSNALVSGVRTLPYSLGASVTSVIGGLLMGKVYRNYKVILGVAFAVMTLGYGLMILMDARSSIAVQTITQLIAALGIGFGFPVPLIALQSAMPPSSIATATATFGLVRTLAGAIGITIGGSIYGSELKKRLPGIQGFDASAITGGAASALAYPISALRDIQPPAVRAEVLQAYSLSIRYIWIVATPLAGVAFLLTLLLKVYTLNRPSNKAAEVTEKQPVGDNASDRTEVDPAAEAPKPDVEKGIPASQQPLNNNAEETGIDGTRRKGAMGGGEGLGDSVPL